ncbi:hypothetical protein Tco_1351591 [Tanacetum coccineum]
MLDYGFNLMNTKIYIDNESTICIVKNPVFHSKTKHIEIAHHFIKDAYEKKLIQVLKIHIDDNVADLLTKDFDVSSSQTVNDEKQIHATVDSKEVVVTEASIRSSLLLHDADGAACLTNEAIFQNLALMGYTLLTTQKVFSNMSRKGVKFSGKVTPLFDFMLVPHQALMGEGSEQPIEPQPTPFPTQPSTGDQPPVIDSSSSHDTTQDSRDSLEVTNRSEGDQVQSSHDSPLLGDHTSEKAEGGLNLEELFVLCTNLSNRVLALETSKDAQAVEILKLKDQIKKLKRKWRKNAKPKPTLDAFDDLDADGRDYMETKDVVKEVRQSNETKELNKGSGDKGGSTKEQVSTVVPKTVSTARPELSTVRPDVDATRQEDSMKEEKAKEKRVSIKDIKDSSRPIRSILTLKPLPTIDPKDKGKSVLKEPDPAKKMTRSDFDAAQITRDVEIARQLQVDLQAEVEKERQREEEASKATIAETYDEIQEGIDADALFAAKLQQEEREEYTIEERAKFLAETIEFDDDVSEEYGWLLTLSAEGKEIYDAVKDSKETAGVHKQKVLEEPNSTKVEVKQEGHEEIIRKRPGRRLKMKETKKSKRQKTDADLEEEEQLKAFLKIVPDEEGIIDYEVIDKRFPIINWESKFYDFDRHGTECIYYRIFRSMMA